MRRVAAAIALCLGLAGFSQDICADLFKLHHISIDSVETPYLFYKTCEWMGVHYKYAGETKKGIDCSSFSQVLYREVYCIGLAGGSKDMWKAVTPVKKDSLREGDLLFFKIKKGQISHVGVYLGHNQMAHASVRSGVIISDLDEPYYKKYYFSGGRLKQ